MNQSADLSTPWRLTESLFASLQWVPAALLALVLLIVGLPLFVAIGLLILIVDGRPVFHQGTRLGLHKRPYTMYKFRTLAREAPSVIGSELLSFRHRVTIPFGRFLRDSKLDELPQLLNIIKGDMGFFGPRPERPEVYENLCKHLEGYDRRFAVRPGLVGFSQLFTPHGSPKRLRTLADNRVLMVGSTPLRSAFFVVYAVGAVAWTTVARLSRYVRLELVQGSLLGRHRERRELTRVRPPNATVSIDAGDGEVVTGRIVDINGSALLLRSSERLTKRQAPVELTIEVRFRRRPGRSSNRLRIARCIGDVFQTRGGPGHWRHVITYNPMTDWSQYLVQQYLLGESLAHPFLALRARDRASAARAAPASSRQGSTSAETTAQRDGSAGRNVSRRREAPTLPEHDPRLTKGREAATGT